MAGRTRVRRSSMFLLELMIAILFFSVASAVCTQVFLKARELSLEAEALSEGICICSNAAELAAAADSPEDAEALLRREYKNMEKKHRKLTVACDNNRVLQVENRKENGLYIFDFSYLKPDGTCIYSLELSRFFKEAEEK